MTGQVRHAARREFTNPTADSTRRAEHLDSALAVLGERWTLRIVGQLILFGPSRYVDLRRGVQGIATNLLAARLHRLESAGVVERFETKPPVATAGYQLTSLGSSLSSVIDALIDWDDGYPPSRSLDRVHQDIPAPGGAQDGAGASFNGELGGPSEGALSLLKAIIDHHDRQASDIVTLLRVAANPTRLQILNVLLEDRESSISSIQRRLERISRFGVSKHLDVLERSSLVMWRKSGRTKLYVLNECVSAALNSSRLI